MTRIDPTPEQLESFRAQLASGKDPKDICPTATKAQRKKGEKQPKVESPLETAFLELWHDLGNDMEPAREYRFTPDRKFRLDFAWPDPYLVAVELEGIQYHANIKGMKRDIEKGNLLVLLGWRVLRYTGRDLKDRPEAVVSEVVRLLEQ